MLAKVRHPPEVEEIDEKDVPAAEVRTKGYTVVKAAKRRVATAGSSPAAATRPK